MGGTALTALAATDGPAAHRAMTTLARDPVVGESARRLREIAYEMAERQTERRPWAPSELLEFDRTVTAPVRSGADLFSLVTRLLDDIAAGFRNLDMSPKSVVATAADEASVQDWLGNELNLRSGGRFHAHKEPQIIHRDRPDIVISSSSSPDELAIEIKHGDKGWSFPDLEFALADQLATRYLRTPARRGGILVVSNHRDARFWRDANSGRPMRFSEIMRRLAGQAERIASNDTGPIRVGVRGLDAGERRERRPTRESGTSPVDEQSGG